MAVKRAASHHMSKKAFSVLVLMLLILGAWFSLRRERASSVPPSATGTVTSATPGHSTGAEEDADPPVPVVPGVVTKRDVPIYLDGLGTVQAFNTVVVRARVDGAIDRILFTEGQDVQAGDVLAQIDPRPYQAQLDEALAKKAQDEAQLNNAHLVMKRDEDLIGKHVLDQQSYDTQRYLVDQLAATIEGDQAAIENARTQLDYTRITSPLAGRVGVRMVDQGNIIHAADTGGVVIITQLRPISVLFTLPEQDLQAIRDHAPSGELHDPMKVLAVGRENTGTLGEGTLAVIDNEIDQTTGTIKLKATFPNKDLRLWPGQFVNARLLVTTRRGGLTVPASVVQRGPQGTYVFVIKPDRTVELRAVKVAQVEDGQALIDEGLRAGEHVVIDGQYKLQAGSKVVLTDENGNERTAPPARQAAADHLPGALPVATPVVALRR
jgi:multidrug efflux system membrane fusion protein